MSRLASGRRSPKATSSRRAPRRAAISGRPGFRWEPTKWAILSPTEPERTWGAAWARWVVRFRWPVLLGGIGIALVIALPMTSLRLGLPSGASQPTSNTARRAYDATIQHFGPGFNGALLAVTYPVTSEQTVRAITGRLRQVPNVLTASPAAFQNGTAVIQVIPKTGPDDNATTSLVNQIRNQRDQLSGSAGLNLLVGGPTASNIDVSSKLSSSLPPPDRP